MPSSPSPSAFATIIRPLYDPAFARTRTSIASIMQDFISALRESDEPETPPDFEFDVVVERLLHPAIADGTYSVERARFFLREYSLVSRSRRADALQTRVSIAEQNFMQATERIDELRAAPPTGYNTDPGYASRLAAAESARAVATRTLDSARGRWQRAEAERTRVAHAGTFDARYDFVAGPSSSSAPLNPPTAPQSAALAPSAPVSASASEAKLTLRIPGGRTVAKHSSSLAAPMHSLPISAVSAPLYTPGSSLALPTPLPLRVSASTGRQLPLGKGSQKRSSSAAKGKGKHRESGGGTSVELIRWKKPYECDNCYNLNEVCEPVVGPNALTCVSCAKKRQKCVRYGRNSRGELKGRDRNNPVAIFNGIGHSILEGLDLDERPWAEAAIRSIEATPAASDFSFVDRDALAARIREEGMGTRRIGNDAGFEFYLKYSPQVPGPTEYLYDPTTLPVYRTRQIPLTVPIYNAKLLAPVASAPAVQANAPEVAADEEEPRDPSPPNTRGRKREREVMAAADEEEPRDPSPPNTRGRKREREARSTQEEQAECPEDDGDDDVFSSSSALWHEKNEASQLTRSTRRRSKRRRVARISSSPAASASGLPTVEAAPPPVPEPVSLPPASAAREEPRLDEVDELDELPNSQEYESGYVQPSSPAEREQRSSEVPPYGEPLFLRCSSDELGSGTPRPAAALHHELDPTTLANLQRLVNPDRIAFGGRQECLEDMLDSWRETGGLPASLREHPAVAVHLGAIRSAHAAAVTRENQAILEQRRLERAESSLTGLPFGAFHMQWIGQYDPEIRREVSTRLSIEFSGEGIQPAYSSLYHTGDLRGVLGMRPIRRRSTSPSIAEQGDRGPSQGSAPGPSEAGPSRE